MVGPVGVKALTQLEFELRAYKFVQEIQYFLARFGTCKLLIQVLAGRSPQAVHNVLKPLARVEFDCIFVQKAANKIRKFDAQKPIVKELGFPLCRLLAPLMILILFQDVLDCEPRCRTDLFQASRVSQLNN